MFKGGYKLIDFKENNRKHYYINTRRYIKL